MKQAKDINRNKLSHFIKDNFQVHDWSKVDSLHIIGSFADPNAELTDKSDLDVLLVWNHMNDHVENQNTYPNGITGMESLEKRDNKKMDTKYGRRPVDIIETTPLEGIDIPSFAVRIPVPT